MSRKAYSDVVAGFLEVGSTDKGEVVINHPDLKTDANGVGHIVFSPNQARSLARLLTKKAADADAFFETRKVSRGFRP